MPWSQSGNIKGASGQPGASGASGPAGASGSVGATGASGVPGSVGASGASGTPGSVGATGASGVPGSVGATGATGPTGASGASGVNYSRNISTITSNTTLGAATATDYVVFCGSVASTDTNWSSVTSLLHLNGTNGATTITDGADSPATWSVQAGPTISTAQSKFGGASLIVNSGYIFTGTSSRFNFSGTSFTVEGWIYPTSTTAGVRYVMGQRTSNAANTCWIVYQSGQILQLEIGNAGLTGQTTYSTGNVLTANTWHHIAVVGNGTTMKLYINGTEGTSGTQSSWTSTDRLMCIGGEGGTTSFQGHVDEFRVTKSVARYTANFTAPTAAFPDGPLPAVPTLPSATNNVNRYSIRNVAGATLTVGASGSQAINGATGGYSLTNNSTVELMSDGTGWYSF